jgi:hypothetical protein
MKCNTCIYCKEIKGSYAWCRKGQYYKQISKQDNCPKYKGVDICPSDLIKKQTP